MLKNFIFAILWGILSFSFVFAVDDKELVTYTARDYESPFKSWLPKKEEVYVITPMAQSQEVSLPKLTIEGIIWGGEFPQAIINGTVLEVGDRIEDADILEIEKGSIKLLYQGSIFFLLANEDGDNNQP